MFGTRGRAAQARAAADGRPRCALCGRNVAVGTDGRCLLGHRVRQPDAAAPVSAVATETTVPLAPVDAGADDTAVFSWADELRSLADGDGVGALVGAGMPVDAAPALASEPISAAASPWTGPVAGSTAAPSLSQALDELLAWDDPAGAPPAPDDGLDFLLPLRGHDAGITPPLPDGWAIEATQRLDPVGTGPEPGSDTDDLSLPYAVAVAGMRTDTAVEARAAVDAGTAVDATCPLSAEDMSSDGDGPSLAEASVDADPLVDAELRRRSRLWGATSIALGLLLAMLGGATAL